MTASTINQQQSGRLKRLEPYDLPAAAVVPAGLDWRVEPHRSALLIHDMQRYFLDFFDCTAAPIPDLIANIGRLRNWADERSVPVFYTAQPGSMSTEDRGLLLDLWGPGMSSEPRHTDIVAELAPRPADRVLTKWRYSAFHRSNLRTTLDELDRDQLIIAGVYAHVGCMITAVDAFSADIQPFLVADAVADFSRRHHEQALRWINERCGVVVTTRDLLNIEQPQSESRRRGMRVVGG